MVVAEAQSYRHSDEVQRNAAACHTLKAACAGAGNAPGSAEPGDGYGRSPAWL